MNQNFQNIVNLFGIEALEEMELLADAPRRKSYLGPFVNPMQMTDSEFIKIYRLSKPVFEDVVNLLEPYMNEPSTISGMSISTKVCSIDYILS